MPKQYGTGSLISAGELQIDDLFVTNTRSKHRISVSTIVEDKGLLLINGTYTYETDRPLILVQRDGFPVPMPPTTD